MLGGAAGLALGYVLAQSIHVLFQTGRDASNAFDLHLDLRVLGYTAALSMLAALLFGLAPAVRAARAALEIPKAQTRSVIGGGLRLPRVLVSVQIALCLAASGRRRTAGRSLEKLSGSMSASTGRTSRTPPSVPCGQGIRSSGSDRTPSVSAKSWRGSPASSA